MLQKLVYKDLCPWIAPDFRHGILSCVQHVDWETWPHSFTYIVGIDLLLLGPVLQPSVAARVRGEP